jgi:hypothetical protein
MKNSLMLGGLILKPISQSAGRALIQFDGRVESLPTFWLMRLSLFERGH